MDYGHRLEFGYFLIPDASDPRGVLETARVADQLGYDMLAVQDHPYQPAHFDTLEPLSGGRFEAGLGGVGFLRAAQAMGAPALTIGESLDALEEAVAILRASWSGAPGLRFKGAATGSTVRGRAPCRRTRSPSGWAPRNPGRLRSRGEWPTVGRRR